MYSDGCCYRRVADRAGRSTGSLPHGGGDVRDAEFLLRGANRKCSDHVVGFVALDHQFLDLERLNQSMDIRNLHYQIAWWSGSIRFVIGKQVVAEGFFRRVEDDREVARTGIF